MIYKISTGYLIFACLLFNSAYSYATGTYQMPDEFVRTAFKQQTPEAKIIWIKDKLRNQVENILQHKHAVKRVRYWIKGHRSVWILDEVGKKKPITAGFIIDENKISEVKVLIFRETRGWEVKYPFFTRQFKQLHLTEDNILSQSIDGISGATLSVRALKKLARIALLLNKEIHRNDPS